MVIVKCSFAGKVVVQMTEGNPGNGFFPRPCPPPSSQQTSVPAHFRSSLTVYSNAERSRRHPARTTKLIPSTVWNSSTTEAPETTKQYRNIQNGSPSRTTYFNNTYAQTLPRNSNHVQPLPSQREGNNPGQVFRILLRNPECSKFTSMQTQHNNDNSIRTSFQLENQCEQNFRHQNSTCVSPTTIQLSVSISHNKRHDNDVINSDHHTWNGKERSNPHEVESFYHPKLSPSHHERNFLCHNSNNYSKFSQSCDSMLSRTKVHHPSPQHPQVSSQVLTSANTSRCSGATAVKQHYQNLASRAKGKNDRSCYFTENDATSDTENILFTKAGPHAENGKHEEYDAYLRDSTSRLKKSSKPKYSQRNSIRADSLSCCDTTSNLEYKKKWLLQRRSLDSQLFTRNVSEDMYPFITKDTVFEVELEKDSRGLGLSICGGWNPNATHPNMHLIRIKRLFPLQTAMNCGKLNVGDVLLSVNGRKLTGLTYKEAIEVLRMAPKNVVLIVCRPEEGILPALPENPKFFFSQESLKIPVPQYMELDATLTKIGGTLGFTITKTDDSNPGHYIKTLVKEPALSNGNLQPGDKIILVNGTDISDMSHEEAIDFLRSLPDEVNLCLWRNVAPASSPLSPLSPGSDIPSLDDKVKAKKPKPLLRKEALDMLSDKARQKNEKKINAAVHTSSPSSNTSLGAKDENTTCMDRNSSEFTDLSRDISNTTDIVLHSPTSSGIASLFSMQTTTRDSFSETNSSGLGIEKLSDATGYENELTTEPSTEESSNSNLNANRKPQRPLFLDLGSENLSPRKQMYGMSFTQGPENQRTCDSSDISYKCLDSSESALCSDEALTNITSSESSPVHLPTQSALLKWRGTTLTGDKALFSPEEAVQFQKPVMFMVELERKWNSRLGFSLTEVSTSNSAGIYIKLIYQGSLAAMDGRLQVGDKLLEVNGNPIAGKSIEDVIDLLRKCQGRIVLMVERLPDNFLPELSESPSENLEMHRSQSEQDNFSEISNMNVRNNNLTKQFHQSTTPLTDHFFNKNHNYSSLQMYS